MVTVHRIEAKHSPTDCPFHELHASGNAAEVAAAASPHTQTLQRAQQSTTTTNPGTATPNEPSSPSQPHLHPHTEPQIHPFSGTDIRQGVLPTPRKCYKAKAKRSPWSPSRSAPGQQQQDPYSHQHNATSQAVGKLNTGSIELTDICNKTYCWQAISNATLPSFCWESLVCKSKEKYTEVNEYACEHYCIVTHQPGCTACIFVVKSLLSTSAPSHCSSLAVTSFTATHFWAGIFCAW